MTKLFALSLVALLVSCGGGGDPVDHTCYACSAGPTIGTIQQVTYACTASEAVQHGHPCLK
jgi:hypothetical protein